MSVENTLGNGQAALGALTRQPRILWKQVAIVVGVFVILAGVSAAYYKNTFDSLWERESLDVAQIARCIAEGEGFTTLFLRPFNAALLADHETPNLELNHAPLYPYAVAAAFKLRSPSDQVVAWVSLAFLLATLVATYFLGKIVFDWRTGLLAAAALGISAPILRIATLGQAWTMAAFWFTGLLIFTALHHKCALVERALAGALYAAGAAFCCVLLYMTHNLFILWAIPTAVYFGVTGSWRKVHLPIFLTVLVVLAAPWAYRNYLTTGIPILGANAWDLMAHSDAYPGDVLYRSTNEDLRSASTLLLFPIENFSAFAHKLVGGSSEAASELIRILGVGIAGFVIV
ncbi:MAG: glycosyltransferase family 39 protein, partial [Armatimonadota bacterium]|nr:glycosyltransferase family 39 protein [Armatimonadota bacterium]